ncbi:N,N-dimethylformamidase beta subunit family domain-containing protein [Phaeacidiphilus oryzae]|uniref:N,N-dimethylformamidase beta subunit family domain-containing protein n=1 Tax=Phaeacidiphilus oryzae TaxID=348818 RepID=UPI000AB58D48|nr:N,N-dimethylformamidase beta subunit family domain-containing protein [Phaeacidiphilus oryzae]
MVQDGNPGNEEPARPSGIRRRRFLAAGAAGVAAGAVGLGIAACSADSGGHKGPAAAGDASAGTGHGPSVLTENDRPGSPDWRITSQGPAEAILGYTDKVSVLPGEPFGLHVSTTADAFRVSAYRVGWYHGDQARLVWRSDRVAGRRQSPAAFLPATRTVHAGWDQDLTVGTDGWPEGAYLLRLDGEHGHQRYVPMVVRSASADGRTLLMHAPATWQAYNLWGGYSLYQGENGSYATRSLSVTFDRPYDSSGAEKFMVYERAAVVLAERLGIPLAYTTGIDVHLDPTVLHGATALFSLGHDEYWTPEQRASVTRARDAGTNLAFLGANTCFRRVRLEKGRGGGANRSVVCYKTDWQNDPEYFRDRKLVSTDFREPPAADPESSMTGVYYEGYPTDAPYVVHTPDHWLYEGTGVRRGDSFAHLVGVEYDRVTPEVPTPRPIEVLAHSPLVCNGRHSFSDSAYYSTRSGAGVFGSGTMRWVEGLMAGTRDDGRDHGMDARTRLFVTRTTENLFRAFAAGPAGHTRPARDNLKGVYA